MYPTTIKGIARYLSTQYPNKNSIYQRNDKKGDKKKGDDWKSEDKESNTDSTAGVHVGNTTPLEESTASNGGASVGAHNLEANEQLSCTSRTVEDILGAYFMSYDKFLRLD